MRVVAAFLTLALLACGAEKKDRPVSEPGEKLYAMRGIVLSRSAEDNSLKIDHEAIPGFMEAMTMDYPVRGAKVGSLPADRSRIETKLHVTERSYWITDVKAVR
ncbi:MAG: hypothetical protein DMF56_03685 [Acidobacteria bacterium]|nr:MAG: hypothetical protein DMF56_03685 [Acidobacteriota bacterium]